MRPLRVEAGDDIGWDCESDEDSGSLGVWELFWSLDEYMLPNQ